MANVTAWLKQHNLKAMVTEFGGDNNTMCYQYLRDAVNFMAENNECKCPHPAVPLLQLKHSSKKHI